MTVTVGVDLAAEPKGTAVARVEWADGGARVTALDVGVSDDHIAAVAADADLIGIDCSLGWPEPFVRFVSRHQDGALGDVDTTGRWREPLTMRTTDLACVAHTRDVLGRAVRPLSVSADLLGHTAMHAVALLGELAAAGIPIDRSGTTGRVAEVYPAACLALWGLRRSYKGTNRARLPEVVDEFAREAPWLDLNSHDHMARAGDHAFDAVVAALGARAVELGRATAPSVAELELARREGWIRLPTCSLAGLP